MVDDQELVHNSGAIMRVFRPSSLGQLVTKWGLTVSWSSLGQHLEVIGDLKTKARDLENLVSHVVVAELHLVRDKQVLGTLHHLYTGSKWETASAGEGLAHAKRKHRHGCRIPCARNKYIHDIGYILVPVTVDDDHYYCYYSSSSSRRRRRRNNSSSSSSSSSSRSRSRSRSRSSSSSSGGSSSSNKGLPQKVIFVYRLLQVDWDTPAQTLLGLE